MAGWLRLALVAGSLATVAAGVSAQAIYTCVDGQGRRHTADRLIAECSDREQKVLGTSGAVRRTVAPALSPLQQAAQAEQSRREAEEKLRQADERRADRALLARYPTRAAHDEERARNLRTAERLEPAAQREQEILRVNTRFDQELGRLQPLWAQLGDGAGLGAATATAAMR